MEEREINRILKPQKKLFILLFFFLSISFVCIGLIFYVRYNKVGEALDLSELISNGTEEEGQYVKINIAYCPRILATNLEKDYYFYYAQDLENHKYIVKLSNETFKYINSISNQETGELNSIYTLEGFTYNIDSSVENLISLNSNINLDYDGKVYIYENRAQKSEREITMYTISALIGLFFLILAFGYVLPGILRTRKILNNKELVEELRIELESLTDNPYKKQHIYLTKNYIIAGIQAIKYEDIVWGYIVKQSSYGIKVGKDLIVHTKDNKKYNAGSVAGNSNVLEDVLANIQKKNANMRVGYSEENKKIFM